MRRYETIYIMRPNIGEDGITAIADRTNGVIENFGGHIVRQDRWGLKKLAYLIKKESKGFYVYIEYAGAPEAVDEIERLFRIDDKVLKYITVKLDDVYDPAKDNVPAATSGENAQKRSTRPSAEEEEDDDDDDIDDDDSDE
jgi:small subunit ribosomal protein S6